MLEHTLVAYQLRETSDSIDESLQYNVCVTSIISKSLNRKIFYR